MVPVTRRITSSGSVTRAGRPVTGSVLRNSAPTSGGDEGRTLGHGSHLEGKFAVPLERAHRLGRLGRGLDVGLGRERAHGGLCEVCVGQPELETGGTDSRRRSWPSLEEGRDEKFPSEFGSSVDVTPPLPPDDLSFFGSFTDDRGVHSSSGLTADVARFCSRDPSRSSSPSLSENDLQHRRTTTATAQRLLSPNTSPKIPVKSRGRHRPRCSQSCPQTWSISSVIGQVRGQT